MRKAAVAKMREEDLWERQRQGYVEDGPRAWSASKVPFYVTNMPLLARLYSQLVSAFLQDCMSGRSSAALDPGQPLYLVELGAGTGRLAFQMLRELEGIRRLPGAPPLRYVLTDISPGTIEFWKDHPRLRRPLEEGLLDLGRFDCLRDDRIVLDRSGATLAPGSLANPLIVIANYVFDTVPHDVFRTRGGRLEQGHPTPAGSGGGSAWQFEYSALPSGLAAYPHDTPLGEIVEGYRRQLDQAVFLVPTGAIEALGRLSAIGGRRVLLLAGDKGHCRPEQFAATEDPLPVAHGSVVSMMVNFHFLREYVRRLGGDMQLPATPDPRFIVALASLGTPLEPFARLTDSYSEAITAFGPNDLLPLLVDVPAGPMSPDWLASLLRLSGYDPEVAVRYAGSLRVPSEVGEHGLVRLADAAQRTWERFYPVEPADARFLRSIARILFLAGRADRARTVIDEALELGGPDPQTLFNRALCCRALGDEAEAERCLAQANVERGTRSAECGTRSAECGTGSAECGTGSGERGTRKAEGGAGNEEPPSSDGPESARLIDRGNELRGGGEHDAAADCYHRALTLDPNLAAAHANLGSLRMEQGDAEPARRHFLAAWKIERRPTLRLLADTCLPIIYDSLGHLRECREQLIDRIQKAHADGIRVDPTRELVPNLFYLAYQGLADREIHEAMSRFAQENPALASAPARQRPSSRIRIGFLSEHLATHTIGHLNHGLIARLPRDDFEVTVLSIGRHQDPLAQQIRQAADHYVVVPPAIGPAIRTVAQLGLDILFYTDLGMDILPYTMAFSRLAPVPCVTWGHPVTTGLVTIDHFISCEHLETPESAREYTEELVLLPRLSVCYERPAPAEGRIGMRGDGLASRAELGLPADAHCYVCPQTLFKLHPEFDVLLGRILDADPQGHLLLIEGRQPSWTQRLRCRLARTIPDVAGRIRFLPPRSRSDYLSLLAQADVVLDPIHFGGGNSSYEALAMGAPIVTLPSPRLRGRITYALYRQMGYTDLVAADPDDYVLLAVRLATEPDFRRAARVRISESADILFDDTSAVESLAAFLSEAFRKRGRNRNASTSRRI